MKALVASLVAVAVIVLGCGGKVVVDGSGGATVTVTSSASGPSTFCVPGSVENNPNNPPQCPGKNVCSPDGSGYGYVSDACTSGAKTNITVMGTSDCGCGVLYCGCVAAAWHACCTCMPCQ